MSVLIIAALTFLGSVLIGDPLCYSRRYRRWRGGRWARVTAPLVGPRWVMVPRECVERVDEDWRNLPREANP